MTKFQTIKHFVVIVGPSHSGKFLLLYPFQYNPQYGITDKYLWPNTVAQKFFKDNYNINLKTPNESQDSIPELDNILLMNLNLDKQITQYIKDEDDFRFYYLLVNNSFMDTIPRRLNSQDHGFLVMVRDPRILWILDRSTEDKTNPEFAKNFFNSIDEFYEAYMTYIVNKPYVSLIHFEHLIKDYKGVIESKILSFLNYEGPIKGITMPSKPINKFFTSDDVENNKWFGYKDQAALDIVTERCKKYIKTFNYNPTLVVEDIYEGT